MFFRIQWNYVHFNSNETVVRTSLLCTLNWCSAAAGRPRRSTSITVSMRAATIQKKGFLCWSPRNTETNKPCRPHYRTFERTLCARMNTQSNITEWTQGDVYKFDKSIEHNTHALSFDKAFNGGGKAAIIGIVDTSTTGK